MGRRAETRRAGIGIVMLPEIMVSEDIACGRLVRLLLGYAPPTRNQRFLRCHSVP
jgi:DNA-binding transcriptional LysR family regulator